MISNLQYLNNLANGSAGMVLIPELNIALITSGYARSRGISNITGAVFLYSFTDNRNYEAKKLKIKGFDLVLILRN